MLEVTQAQVEACLRQLGIGPGANLLVHSAVQFLGRPVGGVGLYLEALQAVIGTESVSASGTLAVPTFNFGFARGEPFDPLTTPSANMGAFAECVRCQPQALRSPHPLQSIAALGPLAADLAGRDTPSAFDPGSAFERLLELDFDLLLLGADVNAISMVHYCEQRHAVPYRYWKEFRGQVLIPTGWEERTYRGYMRDLQLNPQLNLRPIQERLEERGQWHSIPLNYGHLTRLRLADFVAAGDELLRENPWSLVERGD